MLCVGAALVELIAEKPHKMLGYNAVRLMLRTGCRKSEILTHYFDDAEIRRHSLRRAGDVSTGQ